MRDPVLLDLATRVAAERLVLRSPQAGDGALLYAAIVESLTDLRRFLASVPWVAVEHSVESSELHCRNAAADFIARRNLRFLVFEKTSGQCVGSTGLHRIVWETPKLEVGYWGRTSTAGRGYITEAVGAIVDYAFEQIGAARVELITDEANRASRRVAERCGFALEGVLHHERRAADGTLRDICIYARWPTAAGTSAVRAAGEPLP